MTGTAPQMIDVRVTSDVAPLRDVVVGPVKPFSFEDLIAETDPEDREPSREFLAHNRFALPDAAIALQEHDRFVSILRSNGVNVRWVEPLDTVSIQLYPRDLGFVIDDTFFLARPRTGSRRREQEGLSQLLPRLSNVTRLDEGRIEGGDVIVTERDVLVGMSEHTDAAGVASLRRALAKAGSRRNLVPLEFTHRGVVHLDVKFAMVGPTVGVYEPTSFTKESRGRLGARFELIEATAYEARDLAVNILAVRPDRAILRENADRLAAELETKGIAAIRVDFSQIARFPGAYRCATLPLVRG